MIVHFFELLAVDLFARQEDRIARIIDLDFLQHLSNHDFDVLVVDLHTLEAIDVLDFLDQITGQGLDSEDFQNIVRHRITVHQQIAFADVIAFLNGNVLTFRDQIFRRLDTVIIRNDDNPTLGLVVLSELDPAFGTADDRIVLGTARFEEFGHPGQTARDVARLRRFTRDTRDHVTGLDFLTVID